MYRLSAKNGGFTGLEEEDVQNSFPGGQI